MKTKQEKEKIEIIISLDRQLFYSVQDIELHLKLAILQYTLENSACLENLADSISDSLSVRRKINED